MISLNMCLICKNGIELKYNKICDLCDNYTLHRYSSNYRFASFTLNDDHYEITELGYLLKFYSEYDYVDYGIINENIDLFRYIENMDLLS